MEVNKDIYIYILEVVSRYRDPQLQVGKKNVEFDFKIYHNLANVMSS